MRMRDVFMVIMAAIGLYLGATSPQWADHLAFLPRILLMCMLFLGFLSVGTQALWDVLRTTPLRIVKLTIIRLIVLPVLCFIPFRYFMPDFALGVFLLAAAPIGVMAGVYSLMVHANTALILVGNITTSLLLPLSLPFMLLVTSTVLELCNLGALNMPEHLSLGGMTISLCITILIPFFLAWIIRVHLPKVTTILLGNAYPIMVTSTFFSNLSIFCQYAEVLNQNPWLILYALIAACLLCALMTALALPIARRFDGPTGLAVVMSYGIVNNILILILSMEFFSVHEALVAVGYLVPCYLMLLYYRWYARKHGIVGN
jgi:BASS family bile acid:Na+ symporter